MMTLSPRGLSFSSLFSLAFAVLFTSTAVAQDLNFEFDTDPKPKPLIQLHPFGAADEVKETQIAVKLEPLQGEAADLKPWDEVRMVVTIKMPAGTYTYSQTTPAPALPTRITVSQLTGLEAVEEKFQPDRKFKSVEEPGFGRIEKFEGSVTWTRKYRLAKNAQPAEVKVQGSVFAQVCDFACRQYDQEFDVALVPPTDADAIVHQERPGMFGKPGHAELLVTLAPKTAKPGEKVKLTIEMKVDEDWHTYSITQPKVTGAAPTVIETTLLNLKPLDEEFQPSVPFEEKEIEDLVQGGTVIHQIHHGTIAWSREYEVLPDANKDGFGIEGTVDYQTCQTACVKGSLNFDLKAKADGSVLAPTTKPKDKTSDVSLDEILGLNDKSDAEDTTGNNATSEGLLAFIFTAMIAGFAALLTPCVYPMVPITISFFLKQAENKQHRPTTLALVYCGGIIGTFTVLGLLISAVFQAAALTQLANNLWLNLFLTVVIAFFGISMLGVFEISVPSWLLTWSAGKESKGGIIGTLFMALTFTLVSFTCTFAFASILLAMAAKGQYFWPVVGMLAFSAAFAFPFFLLALFPKLLAKMPKSGGWMNIIKVTLGFLEIGAALKFLSIADVAYFGLPTLLPYGLVMGIWFALAVLAGLYPLGLYRMPHDMPGKFTFGRLSFAAPFLGLAVLLGAALFTSYQPSGFVWDNIAAFAPPQIEAGEEAPQPDEVLTAALGPHVIHDELAYALDFKQAWIYAKENNLPLFLDFTGVNCVNCRKMENTVMQQPETRKRLEKFVRVQIFTDFVPIKDDPEKRASLKKQNLVLQEAFGDPVLPGYTVINPHDPAAAGKLKRLSTYTGMEQKAGEFVKFLDDGFAQWQKDTGQTPAQTTANAGHAETKLAAQQ